MLGRIPVVIVPVMSSRQEAAEAIMARALSFTCEGAMPSAHPTVLSALALSAARPRLPRVEVVRLAEALGDQASHAACAVALLKLEARA